MRLEYTSSFAGPTDITYYRTTSISEEQKKLSELYFSICSYQSLPNFSTIGISILFHYTK